MKRCLPIIREETLANTIFKHVEVKNHIEEELSKVSSVTDPSTYQDKDEVSKYASVLGAICNSDSDKAMSSWASNTLSRCIPGFMLIGGPKLTMSELATNFVDRYDIKSATNASEVCLDENYEIHEELSRLKKELKNTKQTSEKQKILESVNTIVMNNHGTINADKIVLDILNIFCERSQKKTIYSESVLNNVLYLSDWGINSFALNNEMDIKNTKLLIKKIPHVITKCLINEIETNESFSIFKLKEKAKIFREFMK